LGDRSAISTVRKLGHISIDDYLAGELASEVRHEYVDGEVYARVGASKRHNRIVLALASVLRSHLAGGPCATFVADIKVKVGRSFYYPDIVVSCHGDEGDQHYETEPLLIVEVLSESTEARDRFEKRMAY
jgi:Uma2 family endonuclease